MPTPGHTANADKFHALCKELIENYKTAISADLNAAAEQTGKSVDLTFAHNDFTRILVKELPIGVLAGMSAELILQAIGGSIKRRKK